VYIIIIILIKVVPTAFHVKLYAMYTKQHVLFSFLIALV